jgi:cysteine desulfurase
MKQRLQEMIPGVGFNDCPESLYTVLSVCFPKTEKSEFLLMSLDMANICVSGGSACSSGASIGSHVIHAIHKDADCTTIRFSFSKYNTKEEVDTVVEKLKELV